MKLLFTVLTVGLLAAGTAQSQTEPTTNPASTTAATTSPTTVQPSVTPASSMTASPNRRQELYDQYHGITKKRVPLTPTTAPAERPASQPASEPASLESVGRSERPVSSNVSPSGVRIGIRGGVTRLIYVDPLPAINADPTVSFVGGFVVNVGQGTLSFQPELNYARYALKNTAGVGSSLRQAIDRFEIPLLLKIASGSVNTSRFFINVGPYGAYLSGVSLNGQKQSFDGSGGRFSVGAAAGVGAALKAGQGQLTLELRGLYALGNAANGIVFNSAYRALNAQATVGYLFPLGGR